MDYAYPTSPILWEKRRKPEDHCLKVDDWFTHLMSLMTKELIDSRKYNDILELGTHH